jgi:multicomponent Na+:H+ antiporter subunit E
MVAKLVKPIWKRRMNMLLLFFLIWVVFNGRLTLEIALFGIAVAGAVFAFICRFMDYSLQKERSFYKKLPLFLQYLFCLVKDIIVSNITVSHMILTRKETMEPVLVHVHADLKTETARVMLANSITLTPGTITVAMTEDDLLVHCLDKSLSEGMEDSTFVRLLQKLEEV